jgi:hypothetical protein
VEHVRTDHKSLLVLRNKTCDQLYGRDASQEVSIGEKVSPQHTPVYKWVSHNAIMQVSHLCLFLCLIYFILQHVISTLELLGSAKIKEESCDELVHALETCRHAEESDCHRSINMQMHGASQSLMH